MRSPRPVRATRSIPVARSARIVLATALAMSFGALAPVAAVPAASASTTPTAEATTCQVVGADASWGFKESFRSYISGSIAHGEWETSGDVSYATPEFLFASSAGEVSSDGSAGTVPVEGGIHFTGHDGLLDTTVENPSLVIVDAATAQIVVDITGVSMEDAMAGDATAETLTEVGFVEVDLEGMTVTTDGDSVTLAVEDAPTAITDDGFAAFGSYEPGTAFDPLSFTIIAECPAAASPTPEPSTSTVDAAAVDVEPPAAPADNASWLVLTGIGALIAAATAAVVVLRRRRRGGDSEVSP